MGDFFNRAWKYLSGKKRTIALTYWTLLVPATTILWPEGAPDAIDKTSSMIGLILSFIGLGHAAVKSHAATKAAAASVVETDEMPNKTE